MNEEEHFLRNNKSTDFTNTVRSVYNLIVEKFSYKARISQLIEMLRESLGLKEFEIYDSRMVNNSAFESFCMDLQYDFMNGKDVDFTELYDAILKSGDFLNSEIRMFEKCEMEERLWAIFLAITDPGNKHNI